MRCNSCIVQLLKLGNAANPIPGPYHPVGVPTVKNPRSGEPTTLSGLLWTTSLSLTYVWMVFQPFWEHCFGISLTKGCPIVPGTVFLLLFQVPSYESIRQKPSTSESSLLIHSLSPLSICLHHHHLILSPTLSASSIAPSQCSAIHSPPHQPIPLVRNLIRHQTTLLQQMQTYCNSRSTKWPIGLQSQVRLPNSYVVRCRTDHWPNIWLPIVQHSDSGCWFNDAQSRRSTQGSV